MTLSEINFGLASGEVMPEDQYWIKGMPRWDRISNLAGVILPTTPTVRPTSTAAPIARPMPVISEPKISSRNTASGFPSSDTASFWSRSENKPRLAVWSPITYVLISAFFTPLIGTAMIAQNHRATEENVWRGVSWFWLVVWTIFLLAGISLYFAAVPCGELIHWLLGFVVLSMGWFFTCALPHRNFLQSRSFDAAWRTDWGKPVGFGFLAWVIVFTVFLLTRKN